MARSYGRSSRKVGEAVGHRGVAAEDDAAIVSLENIAVVTAVVVVAQTCAPVIDAKGSDPERPAIGLDLVRFAPAEFGDFAKPHPAQKIARVRRGDDGGVLGEFVQRARIDVIEMRM